MDALLDFARGPAFVFAFTFMILGLLRHLILTFWEVGKAMYRAGDKTLPYRQICNATWQWLFPANKLKSEPLFSVTSILFHVAVIVVPVFLAGHIALWYGATGVWWPAIPNGLADILTILAVVTAGALIIQRAVARATRTLSRFQDYALPVVIAAPFISGFFVMHPSSNPLSYQAMLFAHVMSANVLFVLIPVTKLSHIVLIPSVQLVSEVAWHWPSDAGSRVAIALKKENEPI